MQGGVIQIGHWKGQEYKDQCHHGNLQASRGNEMTIQLKHKTMRAGVTQIYPRAADYSLFGITKNVNISVYMGTL